MNLEPARAMGLSVNHVLLGFAASQTLKCRGLHQRKGLSLRPPKEEMAEQISNVPRLLLYSKEET